jgi:hypothetical protein
MKILIKTAHGYLSFQPDGRLEYRQIAGPWENLDVEGFVVEIVPLPAPLPGLDPTLPPGIVVPEPTAVYVAAVKAQCVSFGISLTGPRGAFEITKRVAWGLRSTGLGIGLVYKPSGNNWDGFSVDYLCFQNGDGVDILGDAGGSNTPQWQDKPGEFTGQNRWRAPVQP